MKFFQKHTDSRWISVKDAGTNLELTTGPAPWLRREFTCNKPSAGAKLAICGLGYYEVYLNGKRVGDHILDPLVSVYDKHARYVVYDVGKLLKKGKNAVGVVLGTGWYNAFTRSLWKLEYASWRDFPKMRLEMRDESGSLITASDMEWTCTQDGPITFDGLRNGETYDARKEFCGWAEVGFDDSAWAEVGIIRAPGGLLEEQTAPPIRVLETIPLSCPNKYNVFDLQNNIAGFARITVKGVAGAKVTVRYAERMTDDGDLSTENQEFGILIGERWQTDEYILRGGAEEVWEPRFTYHGFQYIKIAIEGKAELLKLEARRIGSDFASIGNFTTGNGMINTLQTLTRRSYLANFVGIPTDCPHREKNGWTGDAQLASDTGLCNFDAAENYRSWLDTMRDCQRPDGNLPGIVPTGGWGFNWGNGPAWDCALFVIPWNVYLYTGNAALIRENYEAMKLYLDYADSMTVDGITRLGLGDWCSDPAKLVDPRLTNTAIYHYMLNIAADIADILKKSADAKIFRRQAKLIRTAFHREFYRGGGVYAEGELTAMGAALYFGLCINEQVRKATLKHLVNAVEECGATAQFGIIGAKAVPRVLAENGYAELAARFFTQENFPGWAYWVIADHAVSLHEVWGNHSSWNHIMFGDLSAWCFRYPGGFRFGAEHPGYKKLTIQPMIIPEWKTFRAEHRGYITEWECNPDGETVNIKITIPEKCAATVVLPCGFTKFCRAGQYEFIDMPY